ncbi:MAG: HD domain-containing protein [Candidatus Thermoplasmatota archaeon]|jgi:HD superfamily phosphohydrolase|nr:HD domain-containing protein [Candidatus Thermoplasmatota archaeon]
MVDIFENDIKQRTINDSIHSHIRITALENEILKTPAMNRLHNIRSLALANLVFPGATGTRFAHSVGTMHLASKITIQILSSINRRGLYGKLFPGLNNGSDQLRILQATRLAALLHDVGHGPFSHTTENFMLALIRKDNIEYGEYKKLFHQERSETRNYVHEYYSIRIIEKLFEIEGIRNNDLSISPDDVTCLLARSDSKSEIFSTQETVDLFRKIISSEIDADRMDYIMRDSTYTGARFGNVDYERLISCMEVFETSNRSYEIAFNEKALGTIEAFIDSRYKNYKWVVRHHLMVSFDQLIRYGIYDLINTSDLDLSEFHWSEYMKGKMTDSTINSMILENAVEENTICRSLIDRRYAPTSLFKGRNEKYVKFEKEINDASGISGGEKSAISAISSYIQKINAALVDPEIDDGIPRIIVRGKPAIILASTSGPTPFSEESRANGIYIFDDSRLRKMEEISSYFKSLNNEWTNFRPYYISFLVPGETKDRYLKDGFFDEVWLSLIHEITKQES